MVVGSIIRDLPPLISESKPKCWICNTPDMVFVTGIPKAAFGRVEFNAFALFPNELVFDCLEVPPVAHDSFPIAAANIENNSLLATWSNFHLVEVVNPIGAISAVFFKMVFGFIKSAAGFSHCLDDKFPGYWG